MFYGFKLKKDVILSILTHSLETKVHLSCVDTYEPKEDVAYHATTIENELQSISEITSKNSKKHSLESSHTMFHTMAVVLRS